MSQSTFQEVIDRLRKVTEIPTETELGERLGFTQSAWSKRKMRGSLPRNEIDALIASEELNPEFIYNGTGQVHVPVDGESWQSLYVKRLGIFRNSSQWLKNRGHDEAVVNDVLNPKPGSKAFMVIAALRDFGEVLQADLNWLLTAKAAPSLQGSETKTEQAQQQTQAKRPSSHEEIGNRLKLERQRLGFSQADFGAFGGVTRAAQLTFETGERMPDASYLSALAVKGLNVMFVVTGRSEVTDAESSLLHAYRSSEDGGRQLIEQTARFTSRT